MFRAKDWNSSKWKESLNRGRDQLLSHFGEMRGDAVGRTHEREDVDLGQALEGDPACLGETACAQGFTHCLLLVGHISHTYQLLCFTLQIENMGINNTFLCIFS